MLFKKQSVDEKMQKMVKRNKWFELSDYVEGSKEQKVALAKALGMSDSNNSVEILLRLVDDEDEDEEENNIQTKKELEAINKGKKFIKTK